MNDFKKGGFKKSGGDFAPRPKFGNKFGGGDRKFGGASKFGGGKFGGGDRKFSGGSKFGGSRGGDRPFGRPELFPATCSSCGKPCEVPFRPTGEKPVYCRDCFGKQEQAPWRADERGPRPPKREFRDSRPPMADLGGGNDDLKRQLITLESKVNRILEILSKDAKAPAMKAEEVSSKDKKEPLQKTDMLLPKKVKKEKKEKKAKK